MALSRRRPRWAPCLLALSLAALAVPAAPATAQDSPEAAMDAFLDAVAAKEFDQLGELVCAAQRESVVGQFDLSAAFAEIPGLDVEGFMGAFTFGVEDRSVMLVSEEGDEAVLDVSATLTFEVDPETARPFVVQILEGSGVDATDEMVEDALASFVESSGEGQSIAGEMRVVREDGAWLLCDDLTGMSGEEGADASMAPAEASMAPAEGHLCDLASVEELSALGPLTYGTADPSVSANCLYFGDETSQFHSLSLLLDEGFTDVDMLRSVFSDAEELTVGGFPALFTGSELFVATDAGALMISAFLPEDGETEVDLLAHLVAVGELVVPRVAEAGTGE